MPARRRLVAATNNRDKLREIRCILNGCGWELLDLSRFPSYPEPSESGLTLTENALFKARVGFIRTGEITLADDTGLEVDALNGEPGVISARYAGENVTYRDNVALLLRELRNVPESRRAARFRCVMALVGPGMEQIWEGVAEGTILSEPRGENGFGYDPVFWSPELQKTFAEADPEEKNQVSHRARALASLKGVLLRLK